MSDRNCEQCKHRTANGCEKWECEFEPKWENNEIVIWYKSGKGNVPEVYIERRK